MDKLRVALVTVWYPPNNSIAVNRMKAFVKYLKADFDIHVYTSGPESKTEIQEGVQVSYFKESSFWELVKHNDKDSKVSHHLKSLINVVMSKLNVSKWKNWEKHISSLLIKDNKKTPFDIVISSFAPVEAHNCAFNLKKNNPSIKWITDMRDEMSDNPFISEHETQFLRKKEIEFLPYIDAITTVSAPILESFKKLMPSVSFFEEIRNGFDHNVKPNRNFNDVFTFVYAGTFYGKNKPDVFLKVLSDLKVAKRIPENFKINFIGTAHNFSYPIEIDENVHFLPKVNYDKAIELMSMADCNLLFSVPVSTKGRYTGKLFDYISVEKPIIAMVDVNDVASDLIKECEIGYPVDFYDVEAIEKAILNVFSLWENKESLPIIKENVTSQHRKYQVKKLVLFIKNIVEL